MNKHSHQGTLLLAKDIVKRFPGVVALDRVTFELYKGEVHGLVGQNGAGKSTFVKILNGILTPDEGEIFLEGKRVTIRNPREARRLGITLVHQEITLVPYLSVAENIVLGKVPLKKTPVKIVKYIDKYEMEEIAIKTLSELGLKIDPWIKVKDLSVGEQQMVQIARALAENARIICMDEPTSALTPKEVENLFKVIRKLRDQGRSIIYITHHIDEVFKICDRVTVLRDGKKIGTKKINETTPHEVIRMMLGRELSEFYITKTVKATIETERPLLEVIGLTTVSEKARGVSLNNVSFKLYKGEVLGVIGLLGAGKTELGKALYGIEKVVKGKIILEGREIKIKNPQDAIKHGIIYAPESRQREGLVLPMTIRENIALPSLKKVVKVLGILNLNKERSIAKYWLNALKIVAPSIDIKVMNLSGGNQQKVVIAKILETKPKIIIFDEPTMGIDVGTKVEIRRIIADLVKQGISVILLSSDVDEVLALSDRILVLVKGRVVAELENKGLTRDYIIKLMTITPTKEATVQPLEAA